MADKKQFNVRIQNKYSSFTEWYDANPTLLAGEPSFVVVPAETGAVTQEPAVLIKVGDGTTPWRDLPWVSAVAADVADWAKAAEKPEYTATEITGLADYISGEIQDTNTKYKLEQDATDAHILILSAQEIGGDWAEVARITTADTVYDDAALIERIAALEANVGTTPVEDQIDAKIEALDLANTYEQKGAAAQALIDAKAHADGKDEAIAAAQKAGDDAAAAVQALDEDLSPRVEALEGTVGDETEGLVKDVADLKAAVGDANSGLAQDVANLEAAIGDENSGLVKEVADVKTTADAAKEAAEQNAAALLTKAEQADLELLEGRVEAVEGELDTLVGEDTGKSIRVIAAEELAAKLIAADAQESLDTLEEIAVWIQDHPEDAADMNAAIVALQQQLTGIDAGEGTVKKYVDDAIAALAIGDYAKAADLTAAIGRIAQNETDIADLKTRMEAAEGNLGDTNVIETVKVNGTALTPDENKAVDITVPTGALADKDEVAKEDLSEELAAELDAKANTDDLAAVAVTGNINDLEQAENDYVVLFCGDASTLI